MTTVDQLQFDILRALSVPESMLTTTVTPSVAAASMAFRRMAQSLYQARLGIEALGRAVNVITIRKCVSKAFRGQYGTTSRKRYRKMMRVWQPPKIEWAPE